MSAEPKELVFGHALRPLWNLDPHARLINHGSFGATPLELLAEQDRWRAVMERNTSRFFVNTLPDLLRQAANATASFVGVSPDRLAFLDNATSGTNAVLRDLALEPGDEILTTSHVYNAVRATLRYLSERNGAVAIEVPLPLPVTGNDEVVAAIGAGITDRTRLLVVDHVTSASAMTLPVAAIVALAKARGVPVLIDGAHAPGLFALDVDAIGADWYVGNCHKWLCAPKGAAFIAIREGLDRPVHPLAISHAYGEGFTAEFDYIGTRDASPWLCIPAAIGFHERLGGSLLRQRNSDLARQVAERLMAEARMRVVCPIDQNHAMVALRWPDPVPGFRVRARAMHDALYDRHGFEAAITTVEDELCLRISIHAYNEMVDFDGLPAALADVVALTA